MNNNYTTTFLSESILEKAKKNNVTVTQYLINEASQMGKEDAEKRINTYYLNAIKPYIKNESNIVEIGTGARVMTERILNDFKISTYYSFEPTSYLVEYLDDLFKNHKFVSVPTDGITLKSIKSDTIDTILAYNVFTYLRVSVVCSYFKEISRTLKQNGVAILQMLNTDNYSPESLDEFEQYMNRFEDKIPFSKTFLSQYLKQYGLKIINEYQTTHLTQFYIIQKYSK